MIHRLRGLTEIGRTSSATGQEGEEASAATGQAVGGSTTSGAGLGATLSMPGLNVNWPFSQLILAGVKTVEARSYPLGRRNMAQPDVEMWLVEAPPASDAISQGWLFAGDLAVALRPQRCQIVGTVTFSHSDEYGSLQAFRADRKIHRIAAGGQYDWDGTGKRYAWRVSAVRRLAQPARSLCRTGFTKKRSYTVIFAESANIDGLPSGESGQDGHRAATGKRSTPGTQGSAASAASPKSSKRLKSSEVICFVQDQLRKCLEEVIYTAQEHIAALMVADSCSGTHLSAVSAAGHGSQTATGPIVTSATSARDAVAKPVAQEQRGNCIGNVDYSGGASGQQHISTLVDAEACLHCLAESGGSVAGRCHSATHGFKGALSCIEYLVGRASHGSSLVRLEGVTLLSIGKVRGRALRVQPVYLGDDLGRVICTLAIDDVVNRIPANLPRFAHVDISSLMPQASELGLLSWTGSTQMSLRMRPGKSGCNFIFPYDVKTEYSRDLASMSFVRKCVVGTYVAIAMRISDVQARRTSTCNVPYLQLMGVDREGFVVGPLRLWQLEAGDIRPGGAYVVRGLKVVHDRWWDSARGIWIRSAVMPKTIACSVRTAVEDVSDVDTITKYL